MKLFRGCLLVLVSSFAFNQQLCAQTTRFGASGVVFNGGKFLLVGDRDSNEFFELANPNLRLEANKPEDYKIPKGAKKIFDNSAGMENKIQAEFKKMEKNLFENIEEVGKQNQHRFLFETSPQLSNRIDKFLGEIKRDFIRANKEYKKKLHQFEDIAILDQSPVLICESTNGRSVLLSQNGPLAFYDFSNITKADNVGLEGLDIIESDGESQVAILFEGEKNNSPSKHPRLFIHRLKTNSMSRTPRFELSGNQGVRMSRSRIRHLANESWEPFVANRKLQLKSLQEQSKTQKTEKAKVTNAKIKDLETEIMAIEDYRRQILAERFDKPIRATAVVLGTFDFGGKVDSSECAIVLVQDATEMAAKWIVVISLNSFDEKDKHAPEFVKVFSLRRLLGKEMVTPNWEGMSWHKDQIVLVNDNTLKNTDGVRSRNLIVRLNLQGVFPPDDKFGLNDKLHLQPK